VRAVTAWALKCQSALRKLGGRPPLFLADPIRETPVPPWNEKPWGRSPTFPPRRRELREWRSRNSRAMKQAVRSDVHARFRRLVERAIVKADRALRKNALEGSRREEQTGEPNRPHAESPAPTAPRSRCAFERCRRSRFHTRPFRTTNVHRVAFRAPHASGRT
jgi:hypothetical protein